MIHHPHMTIKPNSELVFEPMSFHLMLTDLDITTLSEGSDIILQFKFKNSGVIKIAVPVREIMY